MPMVFVRRWTRLRPSALGVYPSRRAAASTRSRVSSATRASPRSARETVDCESPASRATSWLVSGGEFTGGHSNLLDYVCTACEHGLRGKRFGTTRRAQSDGDAGREG